MVARFSVRFAVAALCLAATLGERPAHAQFVRGRVGGGVVIRAPFVPRIVIGPRPVIRPVVPLVRPVVPYVLPRRVVGGAVFAGAPVARGVTAASAPAVSYSGAQVFASQGAIPAPTGGASVASSSPSMIGDRAMPTESDLQAMDDGSLLNALIDATNQLDADLAQFNTGQQWRTFLQLPADAVPPPTDNRVVLGLSSLKTTLGRYDKIAADSAYRSINGLASFVASRAALAEAVQRFGSRQAPPQNAPLLPPQIPPQTEAAPQISPQSSRVIPASAQEELPAPSAVEPASATHDSERSILAR